MSDLRKDIGKTLDNLDESLSDISRDTDAILLRCGAYKNEIAKLEKENQELKERLYVLRATAIHGKDGNSIVVTDLLIDKKEEGE